MPKELRGGVQFAADGIVDLKPCLSAAAPALAASLVAMAKTESEKQGHAAGATRMPLASLLATMCRLCLGQWGRGFQ